MGSGNNSRQRHILEIKIYIFVCQPISHSIPSFGMYLAHELFKVRHRISKHDRRRNHRKKFNYSFNKINTLRKVVTGIINANSITHTYVSTMCIYCDYCVYHYKSTELVSLYTLDIGL